MQKVNQLRKEISSLAKLSQAFDEIDGIRDNAIKILKNFSNEDFSQLKSELALWKDDEIEILAKIFSRGDSNGNLLHDNYFYGYLFVLSPASIAVVLLDDFFYFFKDQNISCELLLQIKNKLQDLIDISYIERDTYEYWINEITEKQNNCT